MYLLTTFASGVYLHCSHDDPLLSPSTLLLDHLSLRTKLLEDALGVAALVGVGVVVAHREYMAAKSISLAIRCAVEGARYDVTFRANRIVVEVDPR
jgi:hypothetical protein